MANPNPPPPPKEFQFKKGNVANPGGKPVGTRNTLTAQFINTLARDFEKNGKKAIEDCRENNLPVYIKAIASLCPKELELKRPREEMATEELIAALNALTGYLAGQVPTGGDSAPQELQSTH